MSAESDMKATPTAVTRSRKLYDCAMQIVGDAVSRKPAGPTRWDANSGASSIPSAVDARQWDVSSRASSIASASAVVAGISATATV